MNEQSPHSSFLGLRRSNRSAAVCRQAYIHPEILDVASELQLETPRRRPTGLSKEEAAVLVYLESTREGGEGSVGSQPR